uniref:Uncharacterized protein n=1 Tax=Arundo donax TaxID=35708 RepID=A0A0A8ZRB5_ARUDO
MGSLTPKSQSNHLKNPNPTTTTHQ